MKLGIKEPFLKGFAGSTTGIRVDDPADIVYLTSVCCVRAAALPSQEVWI